jgi:hypothetical protein
MRLHPRIPRPRSIAALVMSVGIGGVASLALVTDASAHANIVSGTATCQSNGTFTVTWTVSNDWTLSEHVTEVSASGGGSITGLPADIAASPGTPGKLAHQPFATITATQTGVPGTATNASLTVAGKWSDGKIQGSSKGGVALSGNCTAEVGGTAAVAPTFTDTTCTAVTGSYTIPAASTVANYFVAINNGAAVAASAGTVSVPAGTTVTITAVGKNGVVLTPPTSWTHTFALATGCSASPPAGGGSSSPAPPVVPSSVTPAAPTIAQSNCSAGKISTPFISIPGITGVNYFKGATALAAGNLAVAAGSVTTITAGPIAGFTFAGGSTTTWTLTATPAPSVCTTPPPKQVLGVTFTNKPPAKPPVAVLPFTGMPLLQTTLFGFALLLAGTLLIGSSRRHRFSRMIAIDRGSRRT